MNRIDLYNMDCRDAMSLFLPDNSVDAIVCDPPYGLAFMGKKWDYDVPGVDIWAECLRVLKPGGHLLAFAGLVAAAEREACAQVCESWGGRDYEKCATAIRERGTP